MKLRKIITMGLAAIMAISAMSISAFAESNMKINTKITKNDGTEEVNKNTPGFIILDGEVGTTYKSNGIIYEIVSNDNSKVKKNSGVCYDMYESQTNTTNPIVPYSSKVAFTIALTGTTKRASFTLSGNYKFWKVWTQNTQSSGQTIITIEDSNGNTIGDVAYLPAGYTAQLYSDKDSPFPAGTYRVNYTSGTGLSGTSSCRLATTWDELDVTE